MASNDEEDELIQLSDPELLLAGFMVFDPRNEDKGRIIFSLGEMPIGAKYHTPAGGTLQRYSEKIAKYNGRKIDVQPLEELLGPSPKAGQRNTIAAPSFQEHANQVGETGAETEQIIAAAERTAFRSQAAMARILAQSEQTIGVAASTLENLDRQGEQIKRVQDDLDTIDENQDRIEREMRTIESLGGQIQNMVTKPNFKARNTTHKTDLIEAKVDAKRQKERTKEEKKEQKKKDKEAKKRDKRTKQGKGKKAALSIAADDEVDLLKQNNLPQELRVLSKDAQMAIVETDQMLDAVSSNVRSLKAMAVTMGDTIDDHNRRLSSVNERAHHSDMRTRELDHKTHRMFK